MRKSYDWKGELAALAMPRKLHAEKSARIGLKFSGHWDMDVNKKSVKFQLKPNQLRRHFGLFCYTVVCCIQKKVTQTGHVAYHYNRLGDSILNHFTKLS